MESHSFNDDGRMHSYSVEMTSIPTIDDYDEFYVLYARGYASETKDIFTPDCTIDVYDENPPSNFLDAYYDAVVYDFYQELRRIAELANKVLAVKKGMEKVEDLYRQAYNDYLLGGYVFPDGTAYAKKDIDDLINNSIHKAIECLDTIYCGLCKLHVTEREKLNIARFKCRHAHNNGMGDQYYDEF